MKDKIKMKGKVSAYQHKGEFNEDKKTKENTIFDNANNTFVNDWLKYLRDCFLSGIIDETVWGGTDSWYIRLGTDTTTSTTPDLTALVSEITTNPNSKTGESSDLGNGKFEIKYVCTWHAGTVSGTIGELGLYLYQETNIPSGSGTELCNRLSSADGEISSFTIDDSKSLTIEWRVIYEF